MQQEDLIDVQTSKTKRTFTDIREKVLHDATAGSMTNPLRISGASLAGDYSVYTDACSSAYGHLTASSCGAVQPLSLLCGCLAVARQHLACLFHMSRGLQVSAV